MMTALAQKHCTGHRKDSDQEIPGKEIWRKKYGLQVQLEEDGGGRETSGL